MFVVRVSDNAHYMDEDETYTHGQFPTWAEAVAAAHHVVDRCLAEHHKPGITVDQLFSLYKFFGDDPHISPVPEGEDFSAWEYAKRRCITLCN